MTSLVADREFVESLVREASGGQRVSQQRPSERMHVFPLMLRTASAIIRPSTRNVALQQRLLPDGIIGFC